MASYFLAQGLEDDHTKHEMLGKAFRVSHDDIMRDIKRQQSERAVTMGEGTTSKVGGISQALIDDYNSWVHKEGHVTPAASSVMASYLITNRMEEDHDAHQMMADFFGLTHEDVMRDIKRQQSEQVASMGEGTSLGNMPDSWRQILGDCLGD
jgi:hypothetical protein